MAEIDNLKRKHRTLQQVHQSINNRVETLEAENSLLKKQYREISDKMETTTKQSQMHIELMNKELQASEARFVEQRDSRMKLVAELKRLKNVD